MRQSDRKENGTCSTWSFDPYSLLYANEAKISIPERNLSGYIVAPHDVVVSSRLALG